LEEGEGLAGNVFISIDSIIGGLSRNDKRIKIGIALINVQKNVEYLFF
jgi:hypothetical protein